MAPRTSVVSNLPAIVGLAVGIVLLVIDLLT